MKTSVKKVFVALLCAVMLFGTLLSLAACGGGHTVTFDPNYTGATATTVTVDDGANVEKPTDPQRDGYIFLGWYSDAEAKTEYKFDTAVKGDVTIYAGWEAGITVTYDLNYTGAAANKDIVKKNSNISKPADPERSGYLFEGWFTDSACTVSYGFNSAVTEDIKLYAKWIDASKSYINVTLNMNYTGAAEPSIERVESGKTISTTTLADRVTKISSDDNKYSYDYSKAVFKGWYTDAACTSAFDVTTPVTQATTLYAKWETTFTFEAELTSMKDKTGFGYSLSVNEEELIQTDTASRNQGASFGYSVAFLYAYGLAVNYKVYSPVAVDNVTFSARLSAEYRDIYIAKTNTTVDGQKYFSFSFNVNGTSLDYEPIALTGAKAQFVPNQRPFDNWTISKKVSLQAGWNTIDLVVTNEEPLESTVNAVAPMIDCIYLTTDAELTWEPLWANMAKIRITAE